MTTDNRERFTFRVPAKLMEKVREQSDELGVSVNAFILQVLWDWAMREKEG